MSAAALSTGAIVSNRYAECVHFVLHKHVTKLRNLLLTQRFPTDSKLFYLGVWQNKLIFFDSTCQYVGNRYYVNVFLKADKLAGFIVKHN